MSLYVVLMGVQGAGKGEQARFIRETYGIPHVSTGDLFRAMKTRTDALAIRIQEIMAAGRLIDDETTNQVVAERLTQPDAAGGVIFDGYPRTPNQAEWLEQHLASKGQRVASVLLLELDLFTAFKRAFGRVSAADGKSYNIYYNAEGISYRFEDHPEKAYPPRLVAVVNSTGETLQRRPDDASADAIIKRIDTYLQTTQPLIDHYAAKGLLQRIDADRPITEVSAEISAILEKASR
ncbi:nucleoside monophosphate kinase [Anaerolineae bacterium CFX9]|nr:nucleoside monophosphate kinase [Anaerolineae bacterium CFX9]